MSAAPWFEQPKAAPKPLLVATNSPFGVRIGTVQDLGPLYQTLGYRIGRLQDGRLALLGHDLPRVVAPAGR